MRESIHLIVFVKSFIESRLQQWSQNGLLPLKTAVRDTCFNRGPVVDFEIPHTTRCQKLPYHSAIILWNSLKAETRLSPSPENFKNIVKSLLFEQYRLDNNNVN